MLDLIGLIFEIFLEFLSGNRRHLIIGYAIIFAVLVLVAVTLRQQS